MTLFEAAEMLKAVTTSRATGGSLGTNDDHVYRQLRERLRTDPATVGLLPRFIKTHRNLSEFWAYIKEQSSTYDERRTHLREQFEPLLSYLENGQVPSDKSISDVLSRVDSAAIRQYWERALERRQTDPEGAITMARTLVETVCKHILDDAGIVYDENEELPKLYHLAASHLKLAPSDHTETAIKQILGNCQSVVNGLATLRNRLSDAHGKGRTASKPAPRHAELAVNLAGTMASFLFATLESRLPKMD